MAAKRKKKGGERKQRVESLLRRDDTVMVIAGGNNQKRPNKGKVGKILRFVGERVVVEGLNKIVCNRRQTGPNQPGGRIEVEAPIHISNVMYYVEKLQKPVRLCQQVLQDGRKVRGYRDRESREFVEI